MPNVNFYLKKAEGKPPRSLIYLQMNYSGNRLVFSFGQNINSKDWSKARQRVKNVQQTTADGKLSLNDLLDNLKKECEQAYSTEIKNGIPSVETLRSYLLRFMNKNLNNGKDLSDVTIFNLFDMFISGEIKNHSRGKKGRDKSKNTLQNYSTAKKHLLEYQVITKEAISYDSITLNFFNKFVDYLGKRQKHEKKLKLFFPKMKDRKKIPDLGPNTIAKDITILKTIMSEAVDRDYTNNMQFKHKKFSYAEEETDAVYLTENEIINLYNYYFNTNKLNQVKDLFVFGCFTGLRYSDYSDIQPENIVTIDGDYFIKRTTKKTTEPVIIPCNPIIINIFEKYKNNPNQLPKTISPQKFNEYLKEACRIAGMTETGRLSTALKKELCECVTSHTARRSFATNYYLQGFPTIDLMKITGHKTEKSFLKYIKVSKLDSAKRLQQHINKNWAQRIMKVAG